MSDLIRYAELEKYIFDPFYEYRYHQTASYGLKDIPRESGRVGNKAVSETENQVSNYAFFDKNKEEMQRDYLDRLTKIIDEEKIHRFIEIITTIWYDGRSSRTTSKDIWEIKKSVRNYLKRGSSRKFTINDGDRDVTPLFNTDELGQLLHVTHEMFDHYIQDYLESRPDNLETSINRIYIHRGIIVDEIIPEGDYYEYDFINSYSLSQSVPEQFTARVNNGQFGAMIGGCVNDFTNQILAFAPFIPGMDVLQLELCIIPRFIPFCIRYDGEYSGIHEYTLCPPMESDRLRTSLTQWQEER